MKPIKASIIGASGTLGSAAAFMIATQGLVQELIMLDLNQNLLKSHVMDLEQAMTGMHDMQIRAGNPEDLAGSDLVIMTAGAPWRYIESRMELLDDSLPIMQKVGTQIAQYCPDAVIITATNPVDPLNYALYQITGIDRSRLLGYSFNDSTRFRLMVARTLGVKSTQVEGYVIGEHGEHQVLLFSSVRVDGKPVNFSPEQKKKIREEIPNFLHAFESLGTGRTSGWTSAVGLTAMVSAIVKNTGCIYPCSVLLNGEYGAPEISASLPVKLGRQGLQEIIELELSPDERDELESSFTFLQGVTERVKKSLQGI